MRQAGKPTSDGARIRRRFFSRRVWRWLAVLAVIVVGGGVAGVEVTSRSSFCNSCHLMSSYYESWESGGHRGVPCVECHIAPGTSNYISAKLNGLGQVVDDLLNRTSTKPSASVSDFTCTRTGCHAIEKLGTVDSQDRPFFFDHGKHLDSEYRGIAVHCTTCHSHVKGSRHFEVNTNVCITCHLPHGEPTAVASPPRGAALPGPSVPGAPVPAGNHAPSRPAAANGEAESILASSRCTTCHEAPQETFEHEGLIVDHAEYLRHGAACESCHRGAKSKPRPISDSRCLTCHVFGIERATSTVQLHRIHTLGRHKVECFNCHGVTRHGRNAEAMSLDAFDCRSCHTAQHAAQRSAYIRPGSIAHQPQDRVAVSPMFLAHVDCRGCHVEPRRLTVKPASRATVAAASPEACDRCHREGFGEQMIPLWQRTTRGLYDAAVRLLPTAANPWSDGNPEAQAQVTHARRLLELVRVDGSWGVHNPPYTQELIEQARQRLVDAGALMTAGEGDPR